MDTTEVWKDAVGFDNLEVSNLGRVRNKKSKELKSQRISKNGYCILTIKQGGKQYTTYAHRMVALAFLPREDGKDVVNHKDENKTNNNVSNLEWCTYSYNALYNGASKRAGDKMRGKHPSCKKVRCVETGEVFSSVRDAARKYGITMGISYCLCGKQKHAAGYRWEVCE